MTPSTICHRLRHRPSGPRRQSLLLRAAANPECVEIAQQTARAGLASDPREGVQWAALAVEIAEQQGDHRAAAASRRLQGQLLRTLEDHVAAIEAFRAAARAANLAGDPHLASQVQLGSIDSLAMLGRYEEALELARRLEADFSALGATLDAGKALVNAGIIYGRRDEHQQALACYERASHAFAGAQDEMAAAFVWVNSANALTQLGRIEDAIDLYDRAREVFTLLGRPAEAAAVDLNAGFLHHVSGRHSAALGTLTRAHRTFLDAGREQQAARCAVDRGDVYRALNLYAEAIADYDAAVAAFTLLPNEYDRARAELGRAGTLMCLSRAPEAMSALEDAEAVFRRQKNRLAGAYVRLMRATAKREAGDLAGAVRDAAAAERMFRRYGATAWAAEARFITAEQALASGAGSSRPMAGVARAARTSGRAWLECRAERALGQYYRTRRQPSKALAHLRASVAAIERARTLIGPEELHVAFLRDKLGAFEDLVGLLLQRGRRGVEEAFECVEVSRSRLLLERVNAAIEGGQLQTANSEARARLDSLRAQLSRAYYAEYALGDSRRIVGGAAPTAPSIAYLETAYREALREHEVCEPAAPVTWRNETSRVEVAALKEALARDETLVELYSVQGDLYAFVVEKNSLNAVPLCGMHEAEYLLRRLRYHLQRADTPSEFRSRHGHQLHKALLDTLQQLYGILMAPIANMLTTEKVVMVPYGPLHGLPFHALHDGRQYVVEQMEILYAPSAAMWLHGTRGRSPKDAHALGNCPRALVMGLPARGIESISDEITELDRVLPNARTYCGPGSTLDAFRRVAPECDLLHLATHALHRADNPLFSGLRLADGWLLARDLYEMSLRCELAVLSACRTGVAAVEPGDELFGLVRGFLAAGARSVAASLWSVEDRTTTELMCRFYQHLTNGRTKTAALRAAQRESLNDHPHPYHWAGFIMIGGR